VSNEKEHPTEGFFEAVRNEGSVNPEVVEATDDIAMRTPFQLNKPGFGMRMFPGNSRYMRPHSRALDLESDAGLNALDYRKNSDAAGGFMSNLATIFGGLVLVGIVALVIYNLV
jgi:hypothetical protein